MTISRAVRHGFGLIYAKNLRQCIPGFIQSKVWHLVVLKNKSAFLGKLWVVDIVIVSEELELLCQKGLDIGARFREGGREGDYDGGLGGATMGLIGEAMGIIKEKLR